MSGRKRRVRVIGVHLPGGSDQRPRPGPAPDPDCNSSMGQFNFNTVANQTQHPARGFGLRMRVIAMGVHGQRDARSGVQQRLDLFNRQHLAGAPDLAVHC